MKTFFITITKTILAHDYFEIHAPTLEEAVEEAKQRFQYRPEASAILCQEIQPVEYDQESGILDDYIGRMEGI